MIRFIAVLTFGVFCAFMTEQARAESFTAPDLVKQAGANRMRFDKQLKGKNLEVTGRITEVKEEEGKYVVSLDGSEDGNPFEAVDCQFGPAYEEAVMNMNAGDTITANCVYRGEVDFELGALTLMECSPKK